jgi:hypothetical protein
VGRSQQMWRGLYPIEGRVLAESATRLWPLGEYGHLHGLGHVQWRWEEGGRDYSLLCGVSAQSVAPGALPAPSVCRTMPMCASLLLPSRLRLNTASGSRPPPRPAPHYGPADSHLLRQLNATSRRHLAPEQSVTIINWRYPYSGVSSSS